VSAYKINRGALPMRKALRQTMEAQKKAMEKKMRNAAQLYERQFLNEMVKAMRQTVHHSELSKPSMAERVYRDKLFDNYVKQWTQKGGVGFADIIYKQLVEKYSPFHHHQMPAPKGPLKLRNGQPIYKLNDGVKEEKFKRIDVSLKPSEQVGAAKIVSPWSGVVTKKVKGEDGRTWLQVDHGMGLRSDLNFMGEALDKLDIGDNVDAGETLGQLSTSDSVLNWSVFPQQKS